MLALVAAFAVPQAAKASILDDIASLFGFGQTNGAELFDAGDQNIVVDANSTNSWQNILQGETPSTKNIGRIWTDKTVLSSDYTLEGALTGQLVARGDSDFLVGLSALASTSNLKTTTTTTEPLDIVLVLDESGSMDYEFGGGWVETYIEVNSQDVVTSTGHIETDQYWEWDGWDSGYRDYQRAVQDTRGGEYYALVDGEYVRIQEVTNRVYGERDTSYLEHDHWELNGQTVTPEDTQFYCVEEEWQQSTSRRAALQQALYNFIDQAEATNATIADQNSKIRIAIVGFAGNAETHNQLTEVEGDGADQLERTVRSLSASGATNAGAGMDNARRILENENRTDSNEIVIFFTDGVPTTSNSFSASVANNAVDDAYSIKNNQTNPGTVYSIGIFDDADPDVHEANNQSPESTKANTFMNAVSSNYPSASTWNQLGQRVNDEAAYYKTASDSATLSQIFQDIFDESTENVGSGSPIEEVEHQGADNTPGYLTFTDKLGDYMQVSGDTMTLVFADYIYTGRSADGGATWKFEGGTIENPNPVYPEGDIADITVTVNKGSDLATGDTVTVSIPASLIPMRNYDVDTEAGNITVSDAYPVRVFYGVSLKSGAETALADPSSDEYAAIVAAMGNDKQGTNDTAVEFYSNYWSGDQALGDTKASFTPNAGNRFYYFTANTPLYIDDTFTTRATLNDITSGRMVYYAETYWQQGVNREIQAPVALPAGSPELAYVDYNGSGAAYLPVGTQHESKITGLEIHKGQQGNATATAGDVLNPEWASADGVSQRLGNNGKMSVELPGTLSVTKNAEVAQGSTGPVDENGDSTLADQSFNFTLALEGAPQPAQGEDPVTFTGKVMKDGQQQGGDITFAATGGNFSLKDGETLYVYGLSDGMTYTVSETQQPEGFTQASPVDGDQPANATGTITAGGTASATFVNTYSAEPTSLTAADISLAAQKTLGGRDWRDTDSFKFDIVANDGAPAPEQDASVTVTEADENHAKAFGNIEFTAAGTYTYTVTEDNDVDDPIVGIDYSAESYTVTITVKDDGQGHLTIPADGVTIQKTDNQDGNPIDPAETVSGTTMTFTNIYDAQQGTTNINGTKVYNNESGTNEISNGKFTFQLEALGGYVSEGGSSSNYSIPASEVPMPDGVPADTTVTTTTNQGYGFSFPTIRFESDDVDHTFEYRVTEVKGSEKGMTYSNQVYTLQIVVTDREDNGSMTVVATPSLTPQELSFTNTFDPADVTLTGGTAINGTKTLVGRDMLPDEEYVFTLVPTKDTPDAIAAGYITGITADGLTQTVSGAQNGAETTFVFDPQGGITFNRAGVYTFTMKEIAGNLGGMSYDSHECTVTVTVGLDAQNGVLTASVDYGTVGEGDAQRAGNVFINDYTSSMSYSTAGGIDVTKTLNGRNMRANEFTFTIDGAASDTVTAEEAEAELADTDREFKNPQAAANGTAVVMNKLQGLTFTQADAGKTFNYTVRETKGDLAKIDYADEVYTVSIKVVDNNDGTMHTVTTVMNGDQVVSGPVDSTNAGSEGYAAAQAPFVNTYNPDPAVVTEGAGTGLKVTKQVNGASADVDFSFTLKLTSGDATAVTGLDDKNEASATVSENFAEGDIKEALFGTLSFSKTGAYVFQVTEDLGQDGLDDPAGWTYDTSVETITVNVRNLNSENQYDGVLHAYIEGNNPWFTNSYDADPAIVGDGTSGDLCVTKQVTGAPALSEFEFTLAFDANAQVENAGSIDSVKVGSGESATEFPKEGISRKTDDLYNEGADEGIIGNDTVDFGQLSFTEEGVYTFKVIENTEKPDDANGWTYASGEENAQTITVTVTDEGNDGTLDATTLVDGESTNNPTFVNSYEPGSISYDPTGQYGVAVTKNVVGNGSEDEMGKAGYNFTIGVKNVTDPENPTDEGFSLPNSATGTSDAEGAVAFGNITFSKAGDYEVTVSEVNGGKTNVTYDTHSLVYTLHVTDADYDGYLEVAVDEDTVNEGEATFTNVYYDEKDAKDVFDAEDPTTEVDGELVGVGDTLRYTIDWAATEAGTVSVTDVVPAGTTVADGSISQGGALSEDGRTITWTFENQAFGACGTVSFDVTVDESAATVGEVQNSATISVGDNTYTTNTTKNPVPEKTETSNPDKIGAGTKLSYQISFTNTDGEGATATVVDSLTKGQNYVAGTAKVNGEAMEPVAEGDATTGQTLTWNLSNLAADAEVTITFDVTVTRDAGAEVNNTATVNGHSTNTTTTPYPSDDKKDVFEADDSTTSVNGKLVGVGDELTYTIDWAADENGAVTITDTLPTGTELVADTISDSGAYDEAARTITWSLGEKSKGDKGTVSFNVVVTDAAVSNDPIKNTATITVGENDPKVVTAEVDIPKKTVEDNTPNSGIQVGDVLTYTIEYRNDTDASTNVVITDKLPEGLTFIVESWKATEGHDASLEVTSGGLVWTVSDLAAGASGAITFSARVNENAIKVDNPLTNQATVTVGDNSYKTNTTNDGDKPGTGDLTISKTVTAAEGETPDHDKSFSFTITLKDAGGNPLQGRYAYTIAGGESQTLALDSGVAKIELKHGQSVTITGLPEGASYSVAEESYADEGYVTSLDQDSDGWSGTIDADETIIKVTNVYAPQSAQLDIEGNKRLVDADGNAITSPTLAEIAGEFSFTIKALDGGPLPANTTATNSAEGKVDFDPIAYSVEDVIGGSDEPVESPEDGVVEDDATDENVADEDNVTEGGVSDGEDITSDDTTNDGAATNEDANLEVDGDDGATDEIVESAEAADLYAAPQPRSNSKTFKYEVTENPSTNEGITGDSTVWTLEVTVTVDDDGNVTAEVTSATAVPERMADKGSDFTFVNTVASSVTTDDLGSGALQVTKKVDGAAALEEFSFRLTPAGVYGDAISGLDADGGLTATTSGLKGNVGTQTVNFDKLTFTEPGTYRFNVIETNADPSDTAWTYDNDNARQIVVTVSGDADGDGKLEISTMLEDVDTNNPTFTNVYEEPYVPPIEPDDPDETDPSKPDLDVDKTLTGRDMVAGEFSFKITATGSNADHVSPKTLTGTNDASGNVSFSGDGFKFDEAGEYTFTVSEVLPQDDDPETPGVQHNGVTYDETTYTITAKVTKGTGNKLVATWDLGSAAGGVTFANTYEPDETASVSLGATKVLNGRDLVAGEFTFELVDGQGNVVATATNAADGSVVFSSIEFTEAGTYTYLIREVAGSLANVTYDTATHTATVTVTDNGDGTLTATVLYDGSGTLPVFTNTYKVPEEPGEPTKPSKPEEPQKPATPDTGDHTNAAAPVALALSGVALVAGAYVLRVRRNR